MNDRCCLRVFEQPSFGGLLYGLKLGRTDLELDVRQFFSCCAGEGAWQDGQRVVHRCDLRWRLHRVRSLMQQHLRLYGRVIDPAEINKQPSVELLHHIKASINGPSHGQIVHTHYKDADGPSRLWNLALAAVWRFGVDTHFVSFRKTPMHDLTPSDAQFEREANHRRRLVIVERVAELEKPDLAFDFESIVAYAYFSGSDLIAEFVYDTTRSTQPSPRSMRSFSTKGYFSQRIARHRHQNPLRYVGADCRSRLESMCGEVADC